MPTQNIQVLDRAFDILEELAQSRKPLGLTELSRRTDMSKSTVHRILSTLLERGYAEKTRDSSYVIGSKMFNTLSHHINSLELQAEAKPHLVTLQRATDLTVYLGVRDGPYISIIEKEATDRTDETFTQVGRRIPAHSSSMGKCLLSCLSSSELEEVLYDFGLERYTPNTITDKSAFVKHLHEVRRLGYALDIEETELNHRCIAAPIYDYRGDAIAVVGVSGTNAGLPDDQMTALAQEAVLAAERISSAMGYVA